MPPTQNEHFPCGHLLGAVIIATGATPEIVLVGLLNKIYLYSGILSSGKDNSSCILVGIFFNRYIWEIFLFKTFIIC